MTRKPRKPRIAALSPTAVLRQIDRRLAVLDKKRTALRLRLIALEGEMDTLIKARGAPRRPPSPTRNAVSLHASLTKLLKGREMTVKDAALSVLKQGYRTAATPWTFQAMVGIELSNRERFRRIRRGVYTAR